MLSYILIISKTFRRVSEYFVGKPTHKSHRKLSWVGAFQIIRSAGLKIGTISPHNFQS